MVIMTRHTLLLVYWSRSLIGGEYTQVFTNQDRFAVYIEDQTTRTYSFPSSAEKKHHLRLIKPVVICYNDI